MGIVCVFYYNLKIPVLIVWHSGFYLEKLERLQQDILIDGTKSLILWKKLIH